MNSTVQINPPGRKLQGKVCIVTGAGSSGAGIGNGKATAILFAREGGQVVLVDRNEKAVDETYQQILSEGGTAKIVIADVARGEHAQRITAETMRAYGGIDVLHNNVGVSSYGGVLELAESEWERLFNVNVKSMFLMCKASIPHMLERGGGSIINVSSVAALGEVGIPMLAYSVSKAAVQRFTQSVALEFARRNIRCNTVSPGLIDTPMVHDHADAGAYGTADRAAISKRRDESSPTGKQGSPWDIAKAALYLACSDSSFVNGIDIAVDGGMSHMIGSAK